MNATSFAVDRLPVVVLPQPWVPYAAATLAFRAGSAYEDERTFGFSHFLEHLAFRSGEKGARPLDRVEDLGGELDASTGRETTFLELRLPTEHLGNGLAALAELGFRFEVTPEELEAEKHVLEFESYDDDALDELDRHAKSLLWPDSTLFDDALGDLSLIQRAKPAQLQAHHGRLWNPANALLVIAGGIDPTAMPDLVRRAFAGFTDRPGTRADYSPPRSEQTAPFVDGIEGDGILELVLSWRGWDYGHADNLPTYLLAEMIAGHQTSRLFRRFREEEPLTYELESYADSYLHAGCLSVFASLNPEELEHFLNGTCELLDELKRDGPRDDEMERARRGLRAWFGSELFTPSAATDFAVRRHLLELPAEWWDPESYAKALDHCTARRVRETAAALFRPERAVCALAGPGAPGQRRWITRRLG